MKIYLITKETFLNTYVENTNSRVENASTNIINLLHACISKETANKLCNKEVHLTSRHLRNNKIDYIRDDNYDTNCIAFISKNEKIYIRIIDFEIYDFDILKDNIINWLYNNCRISSLYGLTFDFDNKKDFIDKIKELFNKANE